MVRIAPLRRRQLRDGPRRMGGALGPVLAGSSLLMKDWEPMHDTRQNFWLFVEAAIVGAVVFAIYGLALFEFVGMLLNWVHSLPF